MNAPMSEFLTAPSSVERGVNDSSSRNRSLSRGSAGNPRQRPASDAYLIRNRRSRAARKSTIAVGALWPVIAADDQATKIQSFEPAVLDEGVSSSSPLNSGFGVTIRAWRTLIDSTEKVEAAENYCGVTLSVTAGPVLPFTRIAFRTPSKKLSRSVSYRNGEARSRNDGENSGFRSKT